MDEFYTQEAITVIWNEELEAERLYDSLIEAFDPYAYDADEEDEENEGDYDHLIDSYMEASLFGWDS
jgi:hypothetical protein